MKGKKTGGRTAGTPNKISTAIRDSINRMLQEYYTSELFAEDLAKLEPRERIAAMEKLAQYGVPKLQATTLDVTESTSSDFADMIARLSAENEDI